MIPAGFVHTQGTQLLDGAGNPVKLKGVAFGTALLWEPWLQGGPEGKGMTTMLNKLSTLIGQPATTQFQIDYSSQYITQADVNSVAAAGFNVIRLPFNARYLSSQLPIIDSVISWAAQANVYVILDMHAATCSQNPYFTSDSVDGTAGLWYGTAQAIAACQANTTSAWQTIAARYAGNNIVAGYDLLNEPDGLSMSNPELVAFYAQLISTIRSVDTNHTIIVEGRNYTKDVSPFNAPLDPNLMLSYHQYASSTSPSAQAAQITSAKAAAVKLGGVPIWCGEFGLDTPANISPQIARFNAEPTNAGWSLWLWKNAKRTDNQNGVNTYTAPGLWVTLINWLTSKPGATKPTAAQAQQGIADELVAINNTVTNTQLLQTLQGGL